MSGFLATETKQYVKCHAIIDDRQDVLNRMPWGVTRIRMETIYQQKVTVGKGDGTKLMMDWNILGELL